MRSAAIRDVNFNLGGDGGDRDGGENGGSDGGSSIRHACSRARATIHDLDHISSLRLRENPPTDYYSCGRDSKPRSQVPAEILTIDGISREH